MPDPRVIIRYVSIDLSKDKNLIVCIDSARVSRFFFNHIYEELMHSVNTFGAMYLYVYLESP